MPSGGSGNDEDHERAPTRDDVGEDDDQQIYSIAEAFSVLLLLSSSAAEENLASRIGDPQLEESMMTSTGNSKVGDLSTMPPAIAAGRQQGVDVVAVVLGAPKKEEGTTTRIAASSSEEEQSPYASMRGRRNLGALSSSFLPAAASSNVASSTTSSSPQSSSLSSSCCLTMQIGDPSLRYDVTATVSLFESAEETARIMEEIRVGDVVRFNGLQLLRLGDGRRTSAPSARQPQHPADESLPAPALASFSATTITNETTITNTSGGNANATAASLNDEETGAAHRVPFPPRGSIVASLLDGGSGTTGSRFRQDSRGAGATPADTTSLLFELRRYAQQPHHHGAAGRTKTTERGEGGAGATTVTRILARPFDHVGRASRGWLKLGHIRKRISSDRGLQEPAPPARRSWQQGTKFKIDRRYMPSSTSSSPLSTMPPSEAPEATTSTNTAAASASPSYVFVKSAGAALLVSPPSGIEELVSWYAGYQQQEQDASRGKTNSDISWGAAMIGRRGSGTANTAAVAPVVTAGAGGLFSTSETSFSRVGSFPVSTTRRSLAEIEASFTTPASMFLSNIDDVRVTHCDSRVVPRPARGRLSTIPTHIGRRSPSSSSGEEDTASGTGKEVEGKLEEASYSPSPVGGGGIHHPQEEMQDHQVVGFATVTDRSGAVLSLIDPGNRFGKFFQTAQNDGKALQLSNVLSKKQTNVYGRQLAAEEVVLWPTKKTSVSLFSNTSPATTSSTNKDPLTAIGGVPAGDAARHADEEDPITSHYFSVDSPLLDIRINGTSIWQAIDGTLADLQELLLSADGTNYHQALVKLEPLEELVMVDDEGRQTGLSDTFFADSFVVQSLCGGITPSEWYATAADVAAGTSSRTNSGSAVSGEVEDRATPTAMYASQLLRSILYEAISLRWTIDLVQQPAAIVQVNLAYNSPSRTPTK